MPDSRLQRLRAISLYTGAGGLDYGFEAAGFATSVAVEMDKHCVATLAANRRWPIIAQDVERVATSEILNVAGLKRKQADILIGGPPCQPFSKAGFWATGRAGRLSDPRACTINSFFRILSESLPKVFLFENVEGLGFSGKDEGLQLIINLLARINSTQKTQYSTSVAIVNAADFGVPQVRRRMFIVGARDGTLFKFPAATHGSSVTSAAAHGDNDYRTAWDALYDLEEPQDDSLSVTGKWADLLASIPEGQNYLWHTDRGGGEPLFGWRRRYWSFLLKLGKDRPSWTIQAQPGPATGPFHWNNRKLSKIELARLQTFPRAVIFPVPYTEAQRQIGNAVPSLLAEVLAREIKHQLLGGRRSKELRLKVDLASLPPPPQPRPKSVPSKYFALRGTHVAHPGTGQGSRASMQRAYW